MILHIFRKDARRLWPHIGATLLLLGTLAWHDRWRSDWMPGSTEGWLNLLVPLAWACLIGLAMEQEPLVGDRQFWITRPYRRPTLLAAKALFVVAFIHAPSFIADCYILSAREFSPLHYFPQLLWDQLLLAGALTLPAMALAALVRNFTHFIFEIVAVAVAASFLSGMLGRYEPFWTPVDGARRMLAILAAALVAGTLIWLQYARKRLVISRGVGIAGGVLTGFLFSYLWPPTAFALRSAIKPAQAAMELQISPHQEQPASHLTAGTETRVTVFIPVAFSGTPADSDFHYSPLRTEIIGPGGESHRAATTADYRAFRSISFEAYLASNMYDRPGPLWLRMRFSRALYERLKDEKVTVAGDVALTFYRLGATTWMPVDATQEAAGVGRCVTVVVEAGYAGESQLKVECESPETMPQVRVRLWHPDSGEEWKSGVGRFGTFTSGPRMTWLSPLDRRQTVFTLTNLVHRGAGSRHLVPAGYITTAKVALTPEEVIGYSLLHYEFPDLSLGSYVVQPPTR